MLVLTQVRPRRRGRVGGPGRPGVRPGRPGV